MKYYLCSDCGAGKADILITCMKLVIDCDKELVCPNCNKHLDQKFIKDIFLEFKKEMKNI